MNKENREKREEALKFALSLRGNYIISQALHYAIGELSKVKGVHKEVSNINDMKYLKENFFNLFFDTSKIVEELKKKKKNGK